MLTDNTTTSDNEEIHNAEPTPGTVAWAQLIVARHEPQIDVTDGNPGKAYEAEFVTAAALFLIEAPDRYQQLRARLRRKRVRIGDWSPYIRARADTICAERAATANGAAQHETSTAAPEEPATDQPPQLDDQLIDAAAGESQQPNGEAQIDDALAKAEEELREKAAESPRLERAKRTFARFVPLRAKDAFDPEIIEAAAVLSREDPDRFADVRRFFKQKGIKVKQWQRAVAECAKQLYDEQTTAAIGATQPGTGASQPPPDADEDEDSATSDEDEFDQNRARNASANVESPRPLFREIPPAEPFPLDILGKRGAASAQDVYRATRAPTAICGQSTLATMNVSVMGHVDIELPYGEVKPTAEYFASIGETGIRKDFR